MKNGDIDSRRSILPDILVIPITEAKFEGIRPAKS